MKMDENNHFGVKLFSDQSLRVWGVGWGGWVETLAAPSRSARAYPTYHVDLHCICALNQISVCFSVSPEKLSMQLKLPTHLYI